MSRENPVASLALLAAMVSVCQAGELPAPAAAGTATTAATAPAVDPAARKILDALEKAGDRYRTITAVIGYRVDDRMTGDTERRTGAVKYRKATKTSAAKSHIRFDTLQQGKGRPIKDKIEYGFDGTWLTVAEHRLKQMTRYKNVRALPLGKGPFALPFGQKTDEIVKHFKATTRPAIATDPNNTDYVKLTTRKQYKAEMNFLSLEMWVDRKTHLPVRVRSRDKNKKVTTVVFSKVKTNVELSDEVFHMKRPEGWEYEKVEPPKGKKPAGE